MKYCFGQTYRTKSKEFFPLFLDFPKTLLTVPSHLLTRSHRLMWLDKSHVKKIDGEFLLDFLQLSPHKVLLMGRRSSLSRAAQAFLFFCSSNICLCSTSVFPSPCWPWHWTFTRMWTIWVKTKWAVSNSDLKEICNLHSWIQSSKLCLNPYCIEMLTAF